MKPIQITCVILILLRISATGIAETPYESMMAVEKRCALLRLVVKSFFADLDKGNDASAFAQIAFDPRAGQVSDETKKADREKELARFSHAVKEHPALKSSLERDLFNVTFGDNHRGSVHARIKGPNDTLYKIDFDVVEIKNDWKISRIVLDQYP